MNESGARDDAEARGTNPAPRARRAGLLLALVCLAAGCFEAGEDESGPRRAAPDFELPLVDGRPIRLDEHRGKIVVLDFWATWCAPCEVQMPVLDQLWQRAGGDDLMIVGISVDTRPGSEVADWVAERGFTYPIALGSQQLAMDYNIMGFPALVVVDQDGGIYTQHTGVWSRPELEEAIEAARRAPPPSGPAEASPAEAAGEGGGVPPHPVAS